MKVILYTAVPSAKKINLMQPQFPLLDVSAHIIQIKAPPLSPPVLALLIQV